MKGPIYEEGEGTAERQGGKGSNLEEKGWGGYVRER